MGLLPGLFGKVYVPPAAFQEVTSDPSLAGAEALALAPWLRVVQPATEPAARPEGLLLGAGEREALELALQLKAVLAIDDRRGRRVAAGLGVPHTGTVGILLLAQERGLVARVTPVLDEMVARGFRRSRRLYEEVRRRANEMGP
jgi:predicted nucleic acid-binding protein